MARVYMHYSKQPYDQSIPLHVTYRNPVQNYRDLQISQSGICQIKLISFRDWLIITADYHSNKQLVLISYQ